MNTFCREYVILEGETMEELDVNTTDEESLARLGQHIEEKRDCALLITAFRRSNDLARNQDLNAELKADIRKAGFGFNPVIGHFEEKHGARGEGTLVKEDLICAYAPKDEKETLKNLGKKLGNY